ncbi:MAG: M14 family metallopeptidase [Longimicrobiales bacterium]
MRKSLLTVGFTLLLGAFLLPSPAAAQGMRGFQADAPPGPLPEWFTLPSFRHGVSFFPKVRHPEVEYEAGETLTFDRFHTLAVMYEWMHRWEERYPNLVEVYEVARSFEGRPILQATVTNKATGPATDKPAAFFEGNRHSGEVTAAESALWLMQHLVESYGSDPEITQLLDTRAIYIRPKNNPDGSELYLNTAQSNRSTNRPMDNDGDGLLDEDAPDDLDGDGIILQVRYRPRPGTDDRATMVTDERDPSGRLLRRSEEGEEAEWVVDREGIDNDGDGRINEDGIGGLDLHRNYVENWRPEPGLDYTDRGFTQRGAGAYPLSEIETRSVVVFLLENPNVSVANSMDTTVPMHLRAPSTSPGPERMYPEDLAYYEYFDSVGVAITGYPWAGDVYHDYSSRRGDDDDPMSGSPLFGHGPDFGYWYYGAIWYGDELWNGGDFGDRNGDGEEDDLDALDWDDQENGGQAFKEWTTFQHPTLGEVEIGGWNPKFFSQNPPPRELEKWARDEGLFNLALAKHLPLLEMDGVEVTEVGTDDNLTTYEIQVTWKNVGGLPTALRQAQLVKIVQEDRAALEFDGALTRGEEPRVEILEPSGRGNLFNAGRTEAGATNQATFRVRVRGDAPVEGAVRVLSTRGGVLEAGFTLGR